MRWFSRWFSQDCATLASSPCLLPLLLYQSSNSQSYRPSPGPSLVACLSLPHPPHMVVATLSIHPLISPRHKWLIPGTVRRQSPIPPYLSVTRVFPPHRQTQHLAQVYRSCLTQLGTLLTAPQAPALGQSTVTPLITGPLFLLPLPSVNLKS